LEAIFKRFIIVGAWTFLLSIGISYGSKALLASLPFAPSLIFLFFIILVGVVFDAIGVAATAAREKPFHAMAVDKVPGARQAIAIIRNADKVGTFANDVVGDIAGTVSGAIAASIVFRLLLLNPALNERMWTTVMVAVAAGLTVAGKSLGKGIAIKRSREIVHAVGVLLYWLEWGSGIQVVKDKKNRRRKKSAMGKNRQREESKDS